MTLRSSESDPSGPCCSAREFLQESKLLRISVSVGVTTQHLGEETNESAHVKERVRF